MFRRLLGLVILLVSLILVAILLGGAYYVGDAVDSVGASLDNILTLTSDTLSNVSLTLEQTRATVVEANNALDTASEAAVNLSVTMNDMQPLLESTTKVVTEDVPGNIDAIQEAIPNIAQVAGVIDGVLTRLSNFGISQTIPIPFNPITLEFDLGIEYEPEEPFDESIWALGESLEGMPEELRSLQGDLNTLSGDLELLTGNIETASGDIQKINEEVALFIPIIDEYLVIVEQIKGTLLETKARLFNQLETVKTGLVILLLFLSLTQLAPLYLAWELITGQRSPGKNKTAVDETPPPTPREAEEEQEKPKTSEKVVEVEDEQTAIVVEEQEALETADVGEPSETIIEEPSQESYFEGDDNQE